MNAPGRARSRVREPFLRVQEGGWDKMPHADHDSGGLQAADILDESAREQMHRRFEVGWDIINGLS
jgi:hypothetical protein